MSDVEVKVTVTRSGRVSKPPVRYEPEEVCDDDYSDDEYDSDSDVDSILTSDDESESESESDEEDENGNLKGFVVDESEEEESDCD